MLTKMTEEDWEIVLEVFDAGQSERGEPGHDDRKFLEALHYFAVYSITWRALPAEFGKWNGIWKQFWRLSRSGVFKAFLQLLAETSKSAQVIQFSERHRRCLVHRLAHPNDGECQNFCVRGVFSLSPDWASHCIEGTASPASSYTG